MARTVDGNIGHGNTGDGNTGDGNTGDGNTGQCDNGVVARRCPICGKPAAAEARPFCSRRCADVDLGRWLGGGYRVAGRPPAEDDADLPLADPEPPGRAGD
jgi:endogenous inhibitor of DNA gyrase (YacG/DUF329 family)